VSGLGAVPRRARPTVETIALPVARPVRTLSVRAEGASKRILKLVAPKTARAKPSAKRTKRAVRKTARRTS